MVDERFLKHFDKAINVAHAAIESKGDVQERLETLIMQLGVLSAFFLIAQNKADDLDVGKDASAVMTTLKREINSLRAQHRLSRIPSINPSRFDVNSMGNRVRA